MIMNEDSLGIPENFIVFLTNPFFLELCHYVLFALVLVFISCEPGGYLVESVEMEFAGCGMATRYKT
jgi:hypothetical protein